MQGPLDVDSQLAELQRKYRALEVCPLARCLSRQAPASPLTGTHCPLTPPQVNRKAYAEDAQNTIRRQRAAIEKLQVDNTALRRELDAAALVRAP